jgi:putative oxidoreductase
MAFFDRGSRFAPHLHGILRIVAGLMFLQHGLVKLFGFPAGAEPGQQPLMGMMGAAGVIETATGLLIALGLFTRPAAFIAAGFCAAAYWMVHGMQSFFPILNQGELAALYCFVFLYLFAAGPGAFSIDGARGRAVAASD